MSGRKSSEVAQVLAGSQVGRSQTAAMVEKQLAETGNVVRDSDARIAVLKAKASSIDAAPGKEAEEYFPDMASEMSKKHEEARKRVEGTENFGSDFAELQREFARLKAALADADCEADNIRKAIAQKQHGWYCDQEYAQAQGLGKKYQDIFRAQVAMLERGQNLREKCIGRCNALETEVDLLEKLGSDLAALNDMAQKRSQADALRNRLGEIYDSLDKTFAPKFFAEEYGNLGAEIADAKERQDEWLLTNFGEVNARLMDFSRRLAEKTAEWKKLKSDAEAGMRSLDEQASMQLIGPIEFFNNGDKGKKEKLFDFLQNYTGASPSGEFEKIRHAINQAFQKEDFAECLGLMEKASRIVSDARAGAIRLQENMLNKTCLAAELQKAMHSLGYNTRLDLFDGNPNSGFRLGCSIGDEVIDFDHIDINDDGSIAMEINHKAASACGPTWTQIAARLRDRGIPVTDVRLANGQSVICNAVRKIQSAAKERARG